MPSSGISSSREEIGSEMTYFSLAQLLRSNSRQRSLQKGEFGSVRETDLPQMGQRTAAAMPLLSGERRRLFRGSRAENRKRADW